MFWGFFLVLLGGLLLLDCWDLYHGGFISKVVISGLIAWGSSVLFRRTRCCPREDGAVGEAHVESTTTSDSTTR